MPLVLMMGDVCGMRVAGAPSRQDQSLESRSQQPRPAGKSSPRSSKLFAFLKGCKTNKTATKLRKIATGVYLRPVKSQIVAIWPLAENVSLGSSPTPHFAEEEKRSQEVRGPSPRKQRGSKRQQ